MLKTSPTDANIIDSNYVGIKTIYWISTSAEPLSINLINTHGYSIKWRKKSDCNWPWYTDTEMSSCLPSIDLYDCADRFNSFQYRFVFVSTGKRFSLSFGIENLENCCKLAAYRHKAGDVYVLCISRHEDEKRKVKQAIIFLFFSLSLVMLLMLVFLLLVFFSFVAQLKVPPVIIRLFVLFSQ